MVPALLYSLHKYTTVMPLERTRKTNEPKGRIRSPSVLHLVTASGPATTSGSDVSACDYYMSTIQSAAPMIYPIPQNHSVGKMVSSPFTNEEIQAKGMKELAEHPAEYDGTSDTDLP